MKERPKLGRGLEDVSQHYLSRMPQRDPQRNAAPSPATGMRAVGVCHPGSVLMQSCLIANLALELAKRHHPVVVQDFSPPGDARVRSLMGSILAEDDRGPDQAVVRLYGLPEIVIAEAAAGEVWCGGEGPRKTTPGEDASGQYHLVNVAGSLDFILESAAIPDYILLTKTGEKPLIQAYAYIKVMLERSSASKLHLVLDDAPTKDDADLIFSRFSGFVRHRHGLSVNFLGSFVSDESLERSITEKRPIVLVPGRSEAGVSIANICSRFLEAVDHTGGHTAEGV